MALKSFKRSLFDTDVKRTYDRPLEYTPLQYLTEDKQLPTIGYDPQMDVDNYSNGVILAGLQTVALSILRLLYTVPGQYPDYPDLGIDIRKYLFSFEDEFTAQKLREEILGQIPLLSVYVSDAEKFEVIKTRWNDQPTVIIRLASSIRKTNGIEDEVYMNIGITFDEFHKLTYDIAYAYGGEEYHFNLNPVNESGA